MSSFKTLFLFGIICAVGIKILIDLDFNKVVYNHSPGECQYIEGLDSGSEDIVLLSNGLALISSGMQLHAPGMPYSKNAGKIYLYDAKTPDKRPRSLLITGAKFYPALFKPAGLTVWENEDKITVYVVNTYSQEIYVFSLNIAKKSLLFIKSLSHPLLTNPNNIIAVAEDKFYVTNFASSSNAILLNMELSLKLPFGSVLFYNGNQFVQAVTNLKAPNGIGLSPNKQFLYVALYAGEELRVYLINPNSTLSEIMQIPIASGLDNVNVDSTGKVWIGAQPILHEVVLHLQSPYKYAASSQVFRVTFDDESHKKYEVEEFFADDGQQLRAVTCAIVYKDILLIGTLYDKAMWCKLGS